MTGDAGNSDLQRLYHARFSTGLAYRDRIWRALGRYFAPWIPPAGAVLDLGAGYCGFINNVTAREKYAMDFNPSIREQAAAGVTIFAQDCTQPWPLDDSELDVIFTSNFLEHLPDKAAIVTVLAHAHRCLKPGGSFLALGPNIRYVPGAYWDFFDHYVPLTDLSMAEALTVRGFDVVRRIPRFLPYTMSDGREYPIWMLRWYLAMPFFWRLFGKQFLIIGQKRS